MNESMRKHTSLGIGGRALYYVEVSSVQQARDALAYARDEDIPVFILGGGTNLLVADTGIDGIVIHPIDGIFSEMSFEGDMLSAGAGCSLMSAVRRCAKQGLSGFEGLSGIPGSIGGALCGNAGTAYAAIGETVEGVTVLDADGIEHDLNKNEIEFSYRESSLKQYSIIVRAVFRLAPGDADEIEYKTISHMDTKKNEQPYGERSCGCIFKNPAEGSAGKMIDECGLKGTSEGRIEISNLHANFFINRGKGNSREMILLMKRAAEMVREKFNSVLEPEIEMWGDCGWKL